MAIARTSIILKVPTPFSNLLSRWNDIVDNHVYQYILNELGTSDTVGLSTLQRDSPPKRLKKAIVGYVNTYIMQSMFCTGYTLHRRPYDAVNVKRGATRPVSMINPQIPSNQSFHLEC